MWVYHNDLHPILALVDAGYAVLALPIKAGSSSRMGEDLPRFTIAIHIGRRWVAWSRMLARRWMLWKRIA